MKKEKPKKDKFTLTVAPEWREERNPLFPVERWGKDHWSLLAYFETRCVDHGGQVDMRHMTVNADKRGFTNGNYFTSEADKRWNPNHATRLQDGSKPDSKHDDIDVMIELEAEGFIKNIFTDMNPIIQMTERGLAVCARIRAHKANGGQFNGFVLEGRA